MPRESAPLGLYLATGAFLVVIVTVVTASFVRAKPPSFVPTPLVSRPAGDGFVLDTVTIDARDGARWVYFDFDVGSTVENSTSGWDLAINRFHVVANGGEGYAGRGGALAVAAPWDSISEAPADGYTITVGDLEGGAATPALDRWYQYSFFAHTLLPKDETYVIRTAEGRYAKVRILSYYCPQATPGCLTMLYGYQGDGSRRLTP